MIHWLAFVEVLIASLVGGTFVVGLYSLGLRMLAVSGHTPFVPPAEFDEAITVLSPNQVKKEVKKVKKARKRNPHSSVVKRLALAAACALFAVAGLVALFGVYLIVR